jgi:hypothetical protein
MRNLLALAVIGWFAACWTPTYAQINFSPLPRGSQVTLSGKIIGPAQPSASLSRPKASLVTTPPANPYVLPILPPADFDPSEAVASLNLLFANWPDASAYSMYLQMMPWRLQLQKMGASQVLPQPAGTVVLLQPYAITKPHVGIQAVVPAALSALPVFAAVQPPGSDSGPASSVFIVLDGFGAQVPVSVADAMEANFINGFVTRLILGQYASYWQNDSSPASGTGYKPSKGFTIDIAGVNSNQQCLNSYSSAATYPPYAPPGTNAPSFEADIATQLQSCPITSIGMLYGWQAAEDLEKTDSTDPNHLLLKAAWKLLKYRFSFEKMGEMTAYTLDYLNGFAENSRVKSIISNPGGPGSGTVTDINTIVKGVAQDSDIVAAKKFLVSFQNVTEIEFYALSKNTNKHFDPVARLRLTTQYYNFIVGLHRGIAKAADQQYVDTFDLAFGLGYAAGFRDGYALGYAEGYTDGFAAGNAAAWAAANLVISSLQQQIASLQTQLSQAQSAQNGGGSGSGFWNNIGGIVSTAGSVIGTIASFF